MKNLHPVRNAANRKQSRPGLWLGVDPGDVRMMTDE